MAEDYLVDEGTDTIPIPGANGATVTMKRQATYDDELAVNWALPVGVERDQMVKLYVAARTMVMIESWTLKEKDGSPLPITEDVLTKRLSRRVGGFIADEARKRYGEREPEQEAPLGSPSLQPSQETPSTTAEP